MPGSADLVRLLERPVLEVAPRLLGAVLRHGDVAVRLTEVEAYRGTEDPAAHAYHNSLSRKRHGRAPLYLIPCFVRS